MTGVFEYWLAWWTGCGKEGIPGPAVTCGVGNFSAVMVGRCKDVRRVMRSIAPAVQTSKGPPRAAQHVWSEVECKVSAGYASGFIHGSVSSALG